MQNKNRKDNKRRAFFGIGGKKTLIVLLIALIVIVWFYSPSSKEDVVTQNVSTENSNISQKDLQENIAKLQAEIDDLKKTPEQVPAPIQKITRESRIEREFRTLVEHAKNGSQENYAYYYVDNDPSNNPDRFFVNGDKIKIIKYDDNSKTRQQYYNVVFVDRVARTSTGYCIKTLDSSPYCPQGKGPFALTYGNNDKPTPRDWANKIEGGSIIAYESERERPITIISTSIDGQPAQMWLDSYYGYPLKITINPDAPESQQQLYKYDEILYGVVTDEEVAEPVNLR